MSWSSVPQIWWTPPSAYEGAYYLYRDGGERRILAYANGRLYYDIEVW